MKTVEIPIKTTYPHREWHIIPTKDNPNHFSLKTITGDVICTLSFPKNYNTTLVNLIASAPELQDIAEMYHDKMIGNKEEKTMLFSIVTEVLHRVRTQ